jgi:hypothetical protein
VKVGEADTESSNGWSKVFEKRSKRENGDEKTPKGVSGVEHDRD